MPDLYSFNDFTKNIYLCINKKEGGFNFDKIKREKECKVKTYNFNLFPVLQKSHKASDTQLLRQCQFKLNEFEKFN